MSKTGKTVRSYKTKNVTRVFRCLALAQTEWPFQVAHSHTEFSQWRAKVLLLCVFGLHGSVRPKGPSVSSSQPGTPQDPGMVSRSHILHRLGDVEGAAWIISPHRL